MKKGTEEGDAPSSFLFHEWDNTWQKEGKLSVSMQVTSSEAVPCQQWTQSSAFRVIGAGTPGSRVASIQSSLLSHFRSILHRQILLVGQLPTLLLDNYSPFSQLCTYLAVRINFSFIISIYKHRQEQKNRGFKSPNLWSRFEKTTFSLSTSST